MPTPFRFDQWIQTCQFASSLEAARTLGIPEKIVDLYRSNEIAVPLALRLKCEKVKAARQMQTFCSFGGLIPDDEDKTLPQENHEIPPICLDVSSAAE